MNLGFVLNSIYFNASKALQQNKMNSAIPYFFNCNTIRDTNIVIVYKNSYGYLLFQMSRRQHVTDRQQQQLPPQRPQQRPRTHSNNVVNIATISSP